MRRRALLSLLAAVSSLLSVSVAVGGSAAAAEGVTVTGRMQVLVAIGGHGGHRTLPTLVTRGHSWQVRLPGGVVPPTGTVVRVSGTVTGGVLTADRVAPVRLAPAVSTTGSQKVYVIRVHWAGNPADSVSAADITAAFQQAGAWFHEVSYDQLDLSDVQQDPTDESIAAPSGCSVPTATNQIYNRAVGAAGIDETDYDHVVVYYPEASSGCVFAGLGTIAGRGVWLNGDLTPRVMTHELGHNLGLNHSHSLSCVDTT